MKRDKANFLNDLRSIKLNNKWNNLFDTLDERCKEKYLGIKILHLIERDLQSYWLNLAEKNRDGEKPFLCLN